MMLHYQAQLFTWQSPEIGAFIQVRTRIAQGKNKPPLAYYLLEIKYENTSYHSRAGRRHRGLARG